MIEQLLIGAMIWCLGMITFKVFAENGDTDERFVVTCAIFFTIAMFTIAAVSAYQEHSATSDAQREFKYRMVDADRYTNGNSGAWWGDQHYADEIDVLLTAEQLRNPNATLRDYVDKGGVRTT